MHVDSGGRSAFTAAGTLRKVFTLATQVTQNPGDKTLYLVGAFCGKKLSVSLSLGGNQLSQRIPSEERHISKRLPRPQPTQPHQALQGRLLHGSVFWPSSAENASPAYEMLTLGRPEAVAASATTRETVAKWPLLRG